MGKRTTSHQLYSFHICQTLLLGWFLGDCGSVVVVLIRQVFYLFPFRIFGFISCIFQCIFIHLKLHSIHFLAFERCLDVSLCAWLLLNLTNDPQSLGLIFTYETINYSDEQATHSKAFIFLKMLKHAMCFISSSSPAFLSSFSPVEEAVSSRCLSKKWWAGLPEVIDCMAGACQTDY